VLIYNLEGIKDLHLSRAAYTGIFLGTVKNWRDPLIRNENKGLNLPDKEITLVARVDSSGTTQVLTRHLGAVNSTFAKTVGSSKKPVWPDVLQQEGRLEKVAGSGGVAQMVKVLPGSIGYTEYSYAYFTDISMATLQNKAGNYVYPKTHAFLEAIASAELSSGIARLCSIPIEPPKPGAYPILTLTWMLFNQTYENPVKHKALINVLDYCLTEGQKHSIQTGYIPIVEPLLSKARKNVLAIELKK
jgi:phosphate transport system substrate-binding protein